jgi:hypothetical protein
MTSSELFDCCFSALNHSLMAGLTPARLLLGPDAFDAQKQLVLSLSAADLEFASCIINDEPSFGTIQGLPFGRMKADGVACLCNH